MTEHEPGSIYVRLAINEAQHYKRCAEMAAVVNEVGEHPYAPAWDIADVAKWAAYLVGDTDERPEVVW